MKEILSTYMAKYTSLHETEQHAILDALTIETYEKGSHLIKQGDTPKEICFFVLKGCVRKYQIAEYGKEITTHFFTEEEAILLFDAEKPEQESPFSLTCVEDCVLVVGDLKSEQEMYKKYTELETMSRRMMENYLSQTQQEFETFIHSSPEERYKTLIKNRPDLLKRVPQHQLASYLGMTPESLSRIKKRIQL